MSLRVRCGDKKEPNRKNRSAPERRAGARRARGARGRTTGEARRRRAVQRDVDPETNMMQTLTHNATALRCATRSRAGVCAPDCTRTGSGGRVGLDVYLSARGECARREESRERRRSPVELDTDENVFFLEAEPRTRSAARARPGESTHRSRGSIRSRKVSRVRSCGTIARRNARWRENAREYGSTRGGGLRLDEIHRSTPDKVSRSDGSRAYCSDLEVFWSWCREAPLARGHR